MFHQRHTFHSIKKKDEKKKVLQNILSNINRKYCLENKCTFKSKINIKYEINK